MSFACTMPSVAPGKQNGPRFGLPGKRDCVRTRLRWSATRSHCGLSRRRKTVASGRLSMPASSRKPATFRFLLLPPCFPGFRAGGGEAKNGPEGPL